MRILAALPYYAPDGGGLERYAHEILSRLVARGHEVHAIAHGNPAGTFELRDAVVVERVPFHQRVSNTPLSFKLGRRVRELTPKADVVLGHGPVPGALEWAALAARLSKRPFVASYHAGALAPAAPALRAMAKAHRALLERPALALARALIAPSPYVVDAALAPWRERAVVIPPGVDAKRFRPSGTRDPRRVLFVGPLDRAYRWKGFHVLWAAFLRLRAEGVPVTLEAVGEGDEKARYEAQAREAGLGDAFRARGRLDEGALVEAYQRAGMAVLPSITPAESFGMALAEANACGAPVIGARVGGVPCFVRDGENGILIPPQDVEALARAIRFLIENPDKARWMGARGRELVEAEHDWNKAAAATEAVLATVASAT